MSLSSYSKASFALIPPDNTDYDPHSLPPYLSPLELQNLIETSEDKNQTRRTPCLSSKTLLPHCTLPIYQLNYLVPECLLQKKQEEIHELFSVLKLEGVVEVLAPFII